MKTANERILIVEDDEDISFLLKTALTESGYVVESCASGFGIVEMKHEWPDLFILDKHLPVIDGFAVTKFLKIHAATRGIPIIMISAHPVKSKATEAGIDAFLRKPFSIQELLDVIDRCINSSQSGKKNVLPDGSPPGRRCTAGFGPPGYPEIASVQLNSLYKSN